MHTVLFLLKNSDIRLKNQNIKSLFEHQMNSISTEGLFFYFLTKRGSIRENTLAKGMHHA